MEDQITSMRIATLEARMASLEQRLATLEQGSTAAKPKKRKELSPEQRAAIRARLVAGQQAKREREAAAVAKAAEMKKVADGIVTRTLAGAETAKTSKQKEAKNGTSEEKR